MTLPDFLDPLYTAEEMRAADRFAIDEHGVDSLDLMERAGSGLARVIDGVAPRGAVRIVVGGGHNGADGLVAARELRTQGREVDVLSVVSLDELRGDPQIALDRLGGPAPMRFTPGGLVGSSVVVDAMLGTGFEGVALEPVAGAIAALNACPAPTVAADVPSGLDASTGEAEGPVVRATATATNHAPKIGLHVGVGARVAGRITVVDIGIPPGGPTVATAGLIVPRVPRAAARSAASAPGSVRILSAADAAQLLGVGEHEVERRPLHSARCAAERSEAVVVLTVARPLVAALRAPVAVGAARAPPGLRHRIDSLLDAGCDAFEAAVSALVP